MAVTSPEDAGSTRSWGVYEKQDLILVAKVKNGFVPRIRDELFPSLKATANSPVPLHKSARGKGLAAGRIVNRRENAPMRLGQTQAGLPSRIRRMDGCRAPAALHFRRHAR